MHRFVTSLQSNESANQKKTALTLHLHGGEEVDFRNLKLEKEKKKKRIILSAGNTKVTVQSIRARMLLYRNTLITIAVAALVATGGAAKETQQSLATKLVAAAHAQDYDAVVRLITAGTYSSFLPSQNTSEDPSFFYAVSSSAHTTPFTSSLCRPSRHA